VEPQQHGTMIGGVMRRLYFVVSALVLVVSGGVTAAAWGGGGSEDTLTGPPSSCRGSPIGLRCTPGAARSLPCSLDAKDVHCEICRIWWLPGTCGPSIGLCAKAGTSGCERRSVSEPADTSRHQRHPTIRVPPHWI
jgi:hypothetical protein